MSKRGPSGEVCNAKRSKSTTGILSWLWNPFRRSTDEAQGAEEVLRREIAALKAEVWFFHVSNIEWRLWFWNTGGWTRQWDCHVEGHCLGGTLWARGPQGTGVGLVIPTCHPFHQQNQVQKQTSMYRPGQLAIEVWPIPHLSPTNPHRWVTVMFFFVYWPMGWYTSVCLNVWSIWDGKTHLQFPLLTLPLLP